MLSLIARSTENFDSVNCKYFILVVCLHTYRHTYYVCLISIERNVKNVKKLLCGVLLPLCDVLLSLFDVLFFITWYAFVIMWCAFVSMWGAFAIMLCDFVFIWCAFVVMMGSFHIMCICHYGMCFDMMWYVCFCLSLYGVLLPLCGVLLSLSEVLLSLFGVLLSLCAFCRWKLFK